ncbi:MAG TPA: sulfotransferase [Solirubrobacteraceae bacterium]|nr:sulfotransferase [Solirubrobacteraceae bacterium]
MTQRAPTAPTKVVYVMGAGRSGSTILGVCLGNCEDFFFAGELEEWLLRADGPRWAGGERQRFWEQVRERVVGGEGLFGGRANRCIERSSAALRPDLWPARWRMRKAYRRVAEELVEAVSDVARARYVIDSSHFPLRARELRASKEIELYLIYLVRDPRAVLASNLRELSPHEVAERRWRTLKLNADLWLTQLVCALVFLRQPRERRMLVRHEDFLADPEGVLLQILAMTGAKVKLPDLSSLRVGAPLQANRLIRAETVSVKRGAAAERTPRSALTSLLQAPWRPALRRLKPAATATRERREAREA